MSFFGEFMDAVYEFAAKRRTPKQESPVETAASIAEEGRQDWSVIQTGGEVTKDTINGYIRLAEFGDWTQLHTFFDEMRARDAAIETKLSLAEGLVSGAEMQILPYPSTRRNRTAPGAVAASAESDGRRAAEIAAWTSTVIMAPRTRFRQSVKHLMTGFWKGLAALDVVLSPGTDGKDRIEALIPIPSQRFRYAYGSMDLLLQKTTNVNETVPVSSINDRIIVTFSPESHVWNPARRGLLRRALGFFLIRVYLPAWWARGAELFFNPMRIGKYPKGDNQTRDLLVSALSDAGANSFIVIPSEGGMEMADQRDRGISPHESMLEWTDRELSKLFLGATQIVDVQKGTGSISSTSIHQETVYSIAKARAEMVASCIREQILYPLVARNFGPEDADKYTPELLIKVDPQPDMLHFAVALKTFVDAGAGEAIPRAIINEKGYVPTPEDGEPTLPAPGQARGASVPQKPGNDPQNAKDGQPVDQGQGDEPQFGAPPFGNPGEQNMSFSADTRPLERSAVKRLGGAFDILSPYRNIIEKAKADGASLRQLYSRIITMSAVEPDAPELLDILAALQVEAARQGWERMQ